MANPADLARPLLDTLREKTAFRRTTNLDVPDASESVPQGMIPPRRQRYLADIAATVRGYHATTVPEIVRAAGPAEREYDPAKVPVMNLLREVLKRTDVTQISVEKTGFKLEVAT